MAKETCPSCGSPAQPGATRCAVCGASLVETAPAQTASSDRVANRAAPQTAAPRPSTPQGAPPQPAQPPVAGVYPPPAAGVYPPPATAPGAYGYPTAAPHGYTPYGYAPYGYPPYYGYAPYGGYGYGAYGYYPPAYLMKPRRSGSEIYALVIAWIVTVLSAISVLCGLLASLIALLALFFGSGDDLTLLAAVIEFALGPLVAGGFGLWYGIIGILRRPSPRFQLPPAWMMLGLVVVALGGALALWNIDQSLGRAPGAAIGVLPLAFLTGALPALTILAFTSQRLKDPSTRRRVWMSLLYGLTLAPLIAVILEAILTLIIARALNLNAADAQSLSSNTTGGQTSPQLALALFLLLSVVAPLVEEGVKPLGALLLIRRLRTPGEAFLIGLAGGVGFDIFETIGYIGQGQADWIGVAIERIGAGLLHGVGAGMGALFWYYLINGKGVRLRWLRAAGAIAYALLQHGLFNGLSFIGQHLPPEVNAWLNQTYSLGQLPLQQIDVVYVVIYGLILLMLVFMTARLPGAKGMPEPPRPAPQWPGGAPYAPYPYVPWGYGLAPQAGPQAPATAPQAPAMTGGPR